MAAPKSVRPTSTQLLFAFGIGVAGLTLHASLHFWVRSCYVFDERGRYVDWVLDNGESTTWDTNWGQTNRTRATYEEVTRKIRESAPK